MAGAGEPYDHLPFFYSDLFELGYEAVGDLDSRQRRSPSGTSRTARASSTTSTRCAAAARRSCSGTSGASRRRRARADPRAQADRRSARARVGTVEGWRPKSAASRMAARRGLCDHARMAQTVLIVDDHPSFRATARAGCSRPRASRSSARPRTASRRSPKPGAPPRRRAARRAASRPGRIRDRRDRLTDERPGRRSCSSRAATRATTET